MLYRIDTILKLGLQCTCYKRIFFYVFESPYMCILLSKQWTRGSLSPFLLQHYKRSSVFQTLKKNFCIVYRIQSCTILFSDDGELAFDGYAATLNGSVVRGTWTNDDIGKSSTYRELKATYYVFLLYVNQLHGKIVKICADDLAAACVVLISSACLLGPSANCLTNIQADLYQKQFPRYCNRPFAVTPKSIQKTIFTKHVLELKYYFHGR